MHALFEVAVDVLKRSADKNDPKAVVAAIAATKLDTIVGHIAWNGKELPPFAQKNIAKTPLVGGQWRLREGVEIRHRDHRQQDRAADPGRRQDGGDRVAVMSRRPA